MMKKVITIAICVLVLGNFALAHWDENNPEDLERAKWIQLPDRTPNGLDVKAGTVWGDPNKFKILADDFECVETGPITDIHIWGSWKDDVLPVQGTGANPVPDPANIVFFLGIWDDIPDPDGPGGEWSMPGQRLWNGTFAPGDFSVRPAFTGPEGWYDPNQTHYFPNNHFLAYQYNFLINPTEAFRQEGTTTDPKVYWLSVDVDVLDENQEAEFGWKTSMDHWNDDAVWSDWTWVPDPLGGGEWILAPWQELRYPPGHPQEFESIDLAFVITPEPATMTLLALGGLCLIRRRRR